MFKKLCQAQLGWSKLEVRKREMRTALETKGKTLAVIHMKYAAIGGCPAVA